MTNSSKRFSPFQRQCFVSGAVCCDVIAHGCIIGYAAVLLPQLGESNAAIPVTAEEASWIASMMGISIIMGILVTEPLMGQLGRKMAHYVVIFTLLIAWFLFTIANSVTVLIIARILQGLSFGIFTPLRSILIGEYTSPNNRGAFLTVIALAQGLGILLVHLIGSFMSWQRTALICTIFSFTSLIMTIYSPESPSWLVAKGRYDESKKVFHWLRGDDEEMELKEMIQARLANKDTSKESQFKTMLIILKKKEFYKPIIIMSHIYCVLSFSGGMILPSYSPTVIALVKGSLNHIDFWLILFDTQRLLSNVLAIYVMNKFNRRTIMFSMLGLSILNHVATAGYVYGRYLFSYDAVWIGILLLNIQYFTIGMGMIPLPAIIAGEIFPLAHRGLGGSISMISYAAFMFLALKTFTFLIDNLGLPGTYMIYSITLFYNLVVIYLTLPETRGRTLQDIEDELKGMSLKDLPVLENDITCQN